MGQASGSEFKAQMDLGTTVPYSNNSENRRVITTNTHFRDSMPLKPECHHLVTAFREVLHIVGKLKGLAQALSNSATLPFIPISNTGRSRQGPVAESKSALPPCYRCC